jgi:hypothetical protein
LAGIQAKLRSVMDEAFNKYFTEPKEPTKRTSENISHQANYSVVKPT